MLKVHLITCFTVVLCVSSAFAQQQETDPLRVERIAHDHWRITVTNAEPSVLHIPGDPPYGQVRIPGYENELRSGLPSLPLRVVEFGLPPDGRLTVSIQALRTESLPADLVAFGNGTAEVAGTDYAVTTPTVLREGVHVGALRIQPARYEAEGGMLHWLRSCILDVRITGGTAAIAGGHPPSRALDALVNSDDARSWTTDGTAGVLPRRTLRAGSEFLRIVTLQEGMHRVTHDDIRNAGFDPALIDPALFRLTLMGEELPLDVRDGGDGSFDAGDALLFYAARKSGEDGEYHDEWSENQVFFLSWEGTPGARWSDIDAAPASRPSAVPVTEFPMHLHLEEDHDYHRGDDEYSDMMRTERVEGENWIWGYLIKRDGANARRDTIRIRFDLEAPAAHEGVLRVNVRGASRDASMLRATLNGTRIGEWRIEPYQSAIAEWSIPEGLLLSSGNELLLTNPGIIVCPPENPVCSIERFYVDWAQLSYATEIGQARPPLSIDAAHAYGSLVPPAEFRLDIPAAASPLFGYDILRGSRLTGIERSGGMDRLAMDDAGRYYLYTEADIHAPVELRRIRIPDYVDDGRQVDYLVVTHANFRAQAERLAEHRRQSDGYSTVVADVEDLYNAFNEGHKSPAAIRAFVQDAMERRPEPKPRFLLLLGDASWDATQRKATSSKVDFVPTYGNPVSDNYYVSFTEQGFDVTPSLSVGRIPAETAGQAEAVIDKIIAYEQAPVRPWDDRFLFSVGGENRGEQDFFLKPKIDALILNWARPYCIEDRLIVKRTLDFISYDDLDTLIHEVNQGISWFIFAGHGGTRVIDVGIERPDIFDNEDKYIFFVTMSCNTAHFAEPFETGLNERFIMSPRNGAIASLGTSGLGIIEYDYIFNRGMFRALVDSGVRTYGELVYRGKRELLASFGIGSQNAINSANQLTLLGDPATRVPLSRSPELAVRQGDVHTEPEILIEQTAAVIHTRLHNDGICMGDSVDALLQVFSDGELRHSERRRLPPFAVDTLLLWQYDFAGIEGIAELHVTIDAADEIAEQDESNNTLVLTVSVLPRGITQIFPMDRAVIGREGGELVFLLANPSFVPDAIFDPRAEIEYARDATFAGAVQREQAPLGMVFTRLPVTPPLEDGIWYWRARLLTTAGPENWSATRSFTLQGSSVTSERWLQHDEAQFAMTVTEALEPAPDGGVRLGNRPLELEAASGGFLGPLKNSVLRLDGVDVSPDNRGFNLAVVEPVYGRLIDTVSFDTYEDRANADQMAAYITAIPDDHVLMIAVRDDANGYPPSSPDGTNISPALRQALSAYGSTLIDSVGFRESWVLIGRRAAPEDVREAHLVLGTAAARETVIVRSTRGVLRTPVIGPVNVLQTLRWDGVPGGEDAHVDLRLLALSAAEGGQDSVLSVYSDVAPGEEIAPAFSLPLPSAFFRIEAVLHDALGEKSPELRSLSLDYVSRFPELGITSQVVEHVSDSIMEGGELTVRATVYNAGRDAAQDVQVRLGIPAQDLWYEQRLSRIEQSMEQGEEIVFSLPTAGLSGARSYEIGIDPHGEGSEYYRANNVYSRGFFVERDANPPQLGVTFDGVEIANNDFVSPRPLIEIALRDNSPMPVTDTSSVQLFLDGNRIWLMSDHRVRYIPGSGEEKLRIEFTPELGDGLHFIAVSGKDAAGNPADTIPYQVRFNVSSVARIDQLIPYPSPTSGPMDFTFRVTGSEAPEQGRIRIYTVAGRLIREVEVMPGDLRIGFNRVAWDGRDGDGDRLANGVYFYKLILSVQGEQSEQVGRFAVLR